MPPHSHANLPSAAMKSAPASFALISNRCRTPHIPLLDRNTGDYHGMGGN